MMAKQRGTLVVGSTEYVLILQVEHPVVQAGLIHKNIPFAPSNNAWQAAIWGRGRQITLQGYFGGNQEAIEDFIRIIEDWVNDVGLQTTGQYYPMFHKNNTAASTNEQSAYWNVMCDTWDYQYDARQPNRVTFTMILREGTKLGVFSGLSGEAT